MKVLIVGCGSIGRRHARNAAALGAEVALCDLSMERMCELGGEIGASEFYLDIEKAASTSGAAAAVVATPSSLHVELALTLMKAGIHVLMEKPLCADLSEAVELKKIVDKSPLVFMMGHTYRFRTEWQEVKRLLDEKPLGRAYSAEFIGGLYLPDWHVREDYRQEYAAQKRLGGGVLLTSLSHFFDIVSWFFGDISNISGARMQLSELELDVDDAVVCTLKTVDGVGVTLIEDFLSRCPRRTFRVNAEHGYLEADFNRKTISIWDARSKRIHPDEFESGETSDQYFRILEDGVRYDLFPDVFPLQYSGNDAYKAEMACFIDAVEKGQPVHALGIDAGIRVLQALNHAGLCDWTD
jgi:predicted dehydrogenase